MKTRQKLHDPKKATCLVCSHVISLQRPILYVAHDDDAWKFVCRNIGHKMTQLKTIPISEVVQLDATLDELFEMPPGVGAKRFNANSKWEPFLLYPERDE